jgi:hypothetical protein
VPSSLRRVRVDDYSAPETCRVDQLEVRDVDPVDETLAGAGENESGDLRSEDTVRFVRRQDVSATPNRLPESEFDRS